MMSDLDKNIECTLVKVRVAKVVARRSKINFQHNEDTVFP